MERGKENDKTGGGFPRGMKDLRNDERSFSISNFQGHPF